MEGTPKNQCYKIKCEYKIRCEYWDSKPRPRCWLVTTDVSQNCWKFAQFIPIIADGKPKKRPGKTTIKHSAHPWKTTILKRKSRYTSSTHHFSEAMLLGVGVQPVWKIFGVKTGWKHVKTRVKPTTYVGSSPPHFVPLPTGTPVDEDHGQGP